ncbi:MAG: hydroxymethylbilane synthase [Microbacteriaceae bacterium]|nr:hydroxymethylbilane synthase [Microbacteriaceae bacterium]
MIRIGTRGSALALAQSGQVAAAITKATGEPTELVPVLTEGDHSRASLASLGGTGVFASALREALVAGSVDLVVHSLKDLPTDGYEGLRIGAVTRRADARDALCARDRLTLETLQPGARVGTGSPRRVAQLLMARPDLEVVDIRGNVDTRLGTVVSGELDAVVLAAAGLTRLGRLDAISEYLELGRWPSAPGQGALAIEVRDNAPQLGEALRSLNHQSSRLAVLAERAVLAELEAGCAAPIGATAVVDDEMLFLSASVYAPDGTSSLTSSHALVVEGTAVERASLPAELGIRVARELLTLGAAELAPLGKAS